MEDLLYKFLKFVAVGFAGLGVDFGLTFLLKEKLKTAWYFANGVGFMAAATGNYFLNRYWTFESADENMARQYGVFLAVSLVGLGVNQSAVWLGMRKFKLTFYLAKLFAVGATIFWNFTANYFFTFR